VTVHVSIHDVSPAWAREVDVALGMAHEHGVKPALLVVPDYHGRAKLSEDSAFCARLRALEADGHEIFLHGYFHRAEGGGFFAQRVVSAGEAEFSDVSRAEAERRLDDGEKMLRDAGLTIRGFVPPAWSMPRWVHGVLANRGYAFTEDHVRIYAPKSGTSRASLVLNFASRTPARLLSSAAWCRLARPARRLLPTRIAIHPADMRFALLRRETESLLRWAEGDFAASAAELMAG
jgi:predicted deacetylase